MLLSSPDHIGTSAPLLLTWLVLDRGGRRWYVPVITSVLLAWAEVADSIVLIAGIIPLALVCAVRAARTARTADGPCAPTARAGRAALVELDARSARAALAGGALAAAEPRAWRCGPSPRAGGFTVRPLGTQLAPLGEIFRHNLPVDGAVPARCSSARTPPGRPPGQVTVFLLLHLAGVALAAAGVAAAAWRLAPGR